MYIIESGIEKGTQNQRQTRLKERKSGKPYDEIWRDKSSAKRKIFIYIFKDVHGNYRHPKEWMDADIEKDDYLEFLERSIKEINASGYLKMGDSSYVFERQYGKKMNRSCSVSSSNISCNK